MLGQSGIVSALCLDAVLFHGCERVCVVIQNTCLCAHVRTFTAILPHQGIVNSLLTKLLNGVTRRANAFSFFSLLHKLLSLFMLITGERIGNKSFMFHSGGRQCRPAVLMRGTCEPHAVRLWKGLTLPSDSAQDWQSCGAIGRLPFTQPNAI